MASLFQYFQRFESDVNNLPDALDKLMSLLKADFLQLGFEPAEDGSFTASYSYPASSGFSEMAKQYAENRVSGKLPVIFSSGSENIPPFIQESAYEQVLFLPINLLQQRIGVLTLGYLTEPRFEPAYFRHLAHDWSYILIKLLAWQTNREDSQKNFLALTQSFAAIQNRKRLQGFIRNELRSFLNFSHSTLFLLDNDGQYLRDYSSNNEADLRETSFHPFIQLGKLPVDDRMLNSPGSTPPVLDLDELSETRDIRPYVVKEELAGNGLLFNLYDGPAIIGNWILLYEENGHIDRDRLKYLQPLVNQLNTAVLGVRWQEKIEESRKENEILQALNIDFVSIREKKDLLKVVHHKLNNLFEFTHHWVAVINDDESTMTSFLQDTESKAKTHPLYKKVIQAKYPINDRIFNKVLLSKEPLIFDIEQQAAKGIVPEYMQILYDSGIRKIVMIGLQVRARIIGVWAVCLIENQFLNQKQLRQVKEIANQLSIAVDNIKANEAILDKEAELQLLLQLSSDMTTVKNRADLALVINKNLKKLFQYRDIVILLKNRDDDHDIFLFSSDNPDTGAETAEKYSCRDSFFDKVMETDGIQIFNMDNLVRDNSASDYTKKEYRSGIREKVGVRLRDENGVIGGLYVNAPVENAYTDHELGLIKGVSYQLSIAVSNILAGEDIARRQEERELLLSLSIDIAAIRNNNELLQVVSRRLKKLIGFSHISIGILNEDRTSLRPFLLDPESVSLHHPNYESIVNSRFPVNDGIMNLAFAQPSPIVFDLDQLRRQQQLPPYLSMNYERGIRQLAVARFSMAGEVFGVWLLFFDQKVRMDKSKLSLIEGLANQISITVSNIMANEKVNDRLTEVSMTRQQLEEEKIYLKEEIEATHNYSEIIGNSPEVKKIFRLITQVSASDSTVLILGETGTGKELVARAIHNASPRQGKLMVKVNCAALPANLIESELFGHERGSFTGAVDRRVGKFELANNGTLFLDEIGEMPLELQVKLLRALQEKEIERVGGKTTIKVDVRIIAATNRDLQKETEEGRFRSDLFYRLNIFPIHLPALRDRREDIPGLASFFIQRFAKKAGRPINSLNNKALQELLQYNWPGNIRELEHLIERSILLTTGDTIKSIDLPALRQSAPGKPPTAEFIVKTIDEAERDHILATLKYCQGRVAGEGGAAEFLGVPPSTLNSKIKRLGIRREHIR